MTDNYIITYGMHKGKALANIPATYLLWLFDNKKACDNVKAYVRDNLEDLQAEVKNKK